MGINGTHDGFGLAVRFAWLVPLLLVACLSSAPRHSPSAAAVALAPEIETSSPEAQGMSRAPLVKLTEWLRNTPSMPIFSILISRHGKLVYELYTSSFERDDAHYVMSVTKSFVSALVGIAIDRHILHGTD